MENFKTLMLIQNLERLFQKFKTFVVDKILSPLKKHLSLTKF